MDAEFEVATILALTIPLPESYLLAEARFAKQVEKKQLKWRDAIDRVIETAYTMELDSE